MASRSSEQVLAMIGRPKLADLAYFFSRIEIVAGGCWRWTGTMHSSKANSYSVMCVYGGRVLGHRASFTWFVGPIPAGMEPDHLCAHKWCVNPAHLEAVTRADNVYRAWLARTGGFCKRGHHVSGDNVKTTPSIGSTCRICWSINDTKWQRVNSARRSAERAAARHAQ